MKRFKPRWIRSVVQPTHRRARGAAVVEFAVVLPLLLVILFGIIEYGWVFLVRQTLTSAAREGCRVAILQSATDDQVGDRVRAAMAPTGLTEGVWNMQTSDISAAVQSVTVSVPVDSISLTGGFFGTRGYDLTGACSMRKEGAPAG